MSETTSGTGPVGPGGSGDSEAGLGGWWYLSAAVVAVVVGALVWVLVSSRTGGIGTATGTATVTGAVTGTGGTSTSDPGSSSAGALSSATITGAGPAASPVAGSDPAWSDRGCNGSPGNGDAPQEALAGVTWQPMAGVAVPASAMLGPRAVKVPLRQCFAHSPSGAVMAAANIALVWGTATKADYPRIVRGQFTPGPGRDDVLASINQASGQAGNIAGYRLQGCAPAACNVELSAFGGGTYATSALPLVWTKGDWYVDGSRALPPAGLAQGLPDGFTAWTAAGRS